MFPPENNPESEVNFLVLCILCDQKSRMFFFWEKISVYVYYDHLSITFIFPNE